MIDTHYIIKFETVLNSFDPPLVSCLFVIIPVIEGISPELSCGGKCIRRASCHSGGLIVLVKLEHLGSRPCIRTVKRHIDRDIADDLNAFLIRICVKLFPLLIKFILLEFVESDLLREFFSRFCQCVCLAVLQRCIPFVPAHSAFAVLYGHIQAVVVQPECLIRDKLHIVFFVFAALFTETVICFFQCFKSGIIDFLIIDAVCLITEIICLALFLRQKSFFDERLQVDKIRIAGERGERLVRGIPVTSRSKRKYLPVTLARLF